MLILGRKINEKIIIDGNITIAILGVTDKQVQIGIVAPNNISVHREEIQLKIQQQQEELHAA